MRLEGRRYAGMVTKQTQLAQRIKPRRDCKNINSIRLCERKREEKWNERLKLGKNEEKKEYTAVD
jgi:hypothetical protein